MSHKGGKREISLRVIVESDKVFETVGIPGTGVPCKLCISSCHYAKKPFKPGSSNERRCKDPEREGAYVWVGVTPCERGR